MIHRAAQWIVVLQSPAIEVFGVAPFEGIGEIRLLGNVDGMLCHQFHRQLRRSHGEVVQVVPVILPRVTFQSIGQRIDHQYDGRIANGVDAHLVAGIMNFIEVGNQFAFRHVEITPIFALIDVGLEGIGSRSRETAVSEDLDWTGLQKVVALPDPCVEGIDGIRVIPLELECRSRQRQGVILVEVLEHLVVIDGF